MPELTQSRSVLGEGVSFPKFITGRIRREITDARVNSVRSVFGPRESARSSHPKFIAGASVLADTTATYHAKCSYGVPPHQKRSNRPPNSWHTVQPCNHSFFVIKSVTNSKQAGAGTVLPCVVAYSTVCVSERGIGSAGLCESVPWLALPHSQPAPPFFWPPTCMQLSMLAGRLVTGLYSSCTPCPRYFAAAAANQRRSAHQRHQRTTRAAALTISRRS